MCKSGTYPKYKFGKSCFGFLALIAFCFLSVNSFAQKRHLPVTRRLSDYHIDIWNSDNGMPFNSTLHIKQTSDGYIAISSFEGLLRFDGVKFDLIGRSKLPFVKTNTFTAIEEDAEGNLFAAPYGAGIIKGKNWKFEPFPLLNSVKSPVNNIQKMRDGTMLFLTRGEGIIALKGDKAKKVEFNGLTNKNVLWAEEISDGEIWAGTEGEGLWRIKNYKGEKILFENAINPNNVNAIVKARSGKIWLATDLGLGLVENGHLRYIEEFGKQIATSLLLDGDDNLYISAITGLYRIREKEQILEKFTAAEGLHCDDLRGMIFDKEGNLWVSTYKAGIFRLKDAKFSNISYKHGLLDKPINAFIEIGKREYLMGNDLGHLFIFRNGEVLPYSLGKTNADKIKCLFYDKEGHVWIGTYSGLKKAHQDGKIIIFDKENGLADNQVRVIFQDRQGQIWVGMRSGGIQVLKKDGTWQNFNLANGLSSNFIMDIKEDRNGNMLIGTNTSGLDIIQKDGKIINYNTEKGFPSNLIFRMLADEENTYWVTTNAGLVRIKDGEAAVIGFNQGLEVESLYDIKLDKFGFFWIPTVKGIMKVSKQICNETLDGKRAVITYQIFNKTDGMFTEECNGTGQNLLDSEGKLWVTTFRGVSYTDTDENSSEKVKPTAVVEKISIDNVEEEIFERQKNKIVLPADANRLLFQFTGIFLTAPSQLLFEYQLEGFDKQITYTKKDREISYTNLPPGDYTFSLRVGTKEGTWSEPVKIQVRKLPYFWQTAWFWVLFAAAVIIMFYTFYKWRLGAIKRQQEKLSKLIELRTAEINLQKEELLAQRDRIEDQRMQLEKSYHKLNTVSEIGQKVTSVLDFGDLVDLIYKEVNKLLKAEGFGIGLYNPAFNRLDFKGFIEKGEKLPFSYDKISETSKISVQCFLRCEPFVINDLEEYYRNKNIVLSAEHGEVAKSLIYLPLKIETEVLGVITVQSFEKEAYRDYHLTTFQALASYIAIALSNAKAYEIINEKNRNITDSIRYAMTIQHSVLPSREDMLQGLSDVFILSMPKDIVSGDFYWSYSVGSNTHFAVVDCTGHGVPGAFMSLIGHMLLNEIVNVLMIYQPDKILEQLDKELRKALNQNNESNSDGMDVALCFIQPLENEKYKVVFSGAKRPLYFTENKNFIEIKGTKKSIGGHYDSGETRFEAEEFFVGKGAILYLTTDGYADQANEQRQKFSTQRLKALLEEISTLPAEEQKTRLQEEILKHQGNTSQRDDITIAGLFLG
jgi:ligand-binding sensor domain-containing protein/serine phosphatase RsbU (regulator of sigma subunit)